MSEANDVDHALIFADREIDTLQKMLDEQSERIAKLTGTCMCCGWNKETEPPSGQEPPIVKGALDAQAEAERKMINVRGLCDKQANDEGLWANAQTAPEAYVQSQLRRLHAAVKGGDTLDLIGRLYDVELLLRRPAGTHDDKWEATKGKIHAVLIKGLVR